MIKEKIDEILEGYKETRESFPRASRQNPYYDVLDSEIPQQLSVKGSILSPYLIEGSIGIGNTAEIPWVCIFDKEITTSAQHGYYIVYLFDSEMNGVYLSLNQGWTQYDGKYGGKEGKKEIRAAAEHLRDLLASTKGFSFDKIDLHPHRNLGEGYQLGHICGKFYPKGSIPEDSILINDLRNLVGVYRELKGIVGKDIFALPEHTEERDEFTYQQEINRASPANIPSGPLPKPKRISRGSRGYKRDPGIAKKALENAGFVCELDNDHVTFDWRDGGHKYVEAHHLVPMGKQEKFEHSLDVPGNIIALCPNCHRAIHLGVNKDRVGMITKLLEQRKGSLLKSGIDVTLSELHAMYSL